MSDLILANALVFVVNVFLLIGLGLSLARSWHLINILNGKIKLLNEASAKVEALGTRLKLMEAAREGRIHPGLGGDTDDKSMTRH
jgi:hypothetical protein